MILLASFAIVSLGLALGMTLLGYWIVLPFAGMEIGFLAFSLYLTQRRLARKEVITIGPELITVESGIHAPEDSLHLPRYWSRLDYRGSDSPFETGIIALRVHDKYCRLGAALGREEKLQLFEVLKSYFEPHNVRSVEVTGQV